MRALTIRQPWASLIAHGIKTIIETRSWSTKYRGPILIHAGLTQPDPTWEGGGYSIAARHERTGRVPFLYREFIGEDGAISLPLGAVVAVANITDVLPIVDHPLDAASHLGWECLGPSNGEGLYRWRCGTVGGHDVWQGDLIHDQLPYGDFTPGRYGWLLDNIRPLTAPIPAKGRQGLWTPDVYLARRIHQETGRG